MSERSSDLPVAATQRSHPGTLPPQQAPAGRAPDLAAPAPAPAPAAPPAAGSWPTVWQVLLALLVSLAVTAAWRKLLPLSVPSCCDAKQYLRLAEDPTQVVATPYAYRILVPYLAHLLGGVPRVTFDRISLACLVVTGPLVYVLARRLGAVHWAALLAMVGLLSSRAWVYYLYNPWLSDPSAMLLVAVAFLVIVSGRIWLLALVSVVFATGRELFLGLAAPAFGWMRGRLGTVRAALAAGLLVLPGWLVYQWIVRTVPSKGVAGLGKISWHTVVELGPWFEHRGGVGFFFVAATTLSFGCWWILAAMSLGDPDLRRLLWWLIPVFGQFVLGGDWARFALYAFPVVVPAAALTLQRLQPRLRAVILAILGLQLLTPLLDRAPAENLRLNQPGPSVAAIAVLMGVTALVLLAVRVWSRSAARSSR